MTRILPPALALAAGLALTACGGGGLFDRNSPDEMSVTRNQPLVIPPDYSLEPPTPGAPRAIETDSQTQALEALFGPGVRPPEASQSEQLLLRDAGATDGDPTARSTVGDIDTSTVDKGAQVKALVEAPAGTTDATVAAVQNGG